MTVHSSFLFRQPRVTDRRRVLPPLAEYEDWLDGYLKAHPRSRTHNSFDARTYRRIAQVAQTTDSFAEIGRAVGHFGSAVRAALDRLPEHLK